MACLPYFHCSQKVVGTKSAHLKKQVAFAEEQIPIQFQFYFIPLGLNLKCSSTGAATGDRFLSKIWP